MSTLVKLAAKVLTLALVPPLTGVPLWAGLLALGLNPVLATLAGVGAVVMTLGGLMDRM